MISFLVVLPPWRVVCDNLQLKVVTGSQICYVFWQTLSGLPWPSRDVANRCVLPTGTLRSLQNHPGGHGIASGTSWAVPDSAGHASVGRPGPLRAGTPWRVLRPGPDPQHWPGNFETSYLRVPAQPRRCQRRCHGLRDDSARLVESLWAIRNGLPHSWGARGGLGAFAKKRDRSDSQ